MTGYSDDRSDDEYVAPVGAASVADEMPTNGDRTTVSSMSDDRDDEWTAPLEPRPSSAVMAAFEQAADGNSNDSFSAGILWAVSTLEAEAARLDECGDSRGVHRCISLLRSGPAKEPADE